MGWVRGKDCTVLDLCILGEKKGNKDKDKGIMWWRFNGLLYLVR